MSWIGNRCRRRNPYRGFFFLLIERKKLQHLFRPFYWAFFRRILNRKLCADPSSAQLHSFLDADEALSPELKESILKVKSIGIMMHSGWIDWQITVVIGFVMVHGIPDRKVRLFRRDQGKWGGNNPHDRFIPDSQVRIRHLKATYFIIHIIQ